MKPCNSELEWHKCYSGGHDLWVEDAITHPAKMAPALCFRIFQHLQEIELLQEGSVILDFMSGIGTTGIVAGALGYRSIMVELEPYFKDLIGDCYCKGVTVPLFKRMMKGRENRTRKLSYIGTRICPECQSSVDKRRAKGGLRTIFTSGAHYYDGNRGYVAKKLNRQIDMTIIQGDSRELSQLLQEKGLVAVVSPPYIGFNEGGVDGSGQRLQSKIDAGIVPIETRRALTKGSMVKNPRYSHNPHNIGNLPDRVVGFTSPPYDSGELKNKPKDWDRKLERWNASGSKWHRDRPTGNMNQESYGQSEGQIGNEKQESYLDAMRSCYSEAAKICSVLVVVTKNPTRNGILRRLDSDTIAILEETGWQIVCRHKAMLFEEQEQGNLFGGSTKKVKGRLSFFKRLSWQKGAEIAQWEDVVIAVNGNQGFVGVVSPPYGESLSADKIGRSLVERRIELGRDINAPGWIGAGIRYSSDPQNIGNLKDRLDVLQ